MNIEKVTNKLSFGKNKENERAQGNRNDISFRSQETRRIPCLIADFHLNTKREWFRWLGTSNATESHTSAVFTVRWFHLDGAVHLKQKKSKFENGSHTRTKARRGNEKENNVHLLKVRRGRRRRSSIIKRERKSWGRSLAKSLARARDKTIRFSSI